MEGNHTGNSNPLSKLYMAGCGVTPGDRDIKLVIHISFKYPKGA